MVDIGAKNPYIGAINSGTLFGAPLMSRPRLAHLRATWKLSLPAPTAAKVDLMFEDPLTGKPKYGARGKLVDALLTNWLATQGVGIAVPVPTLEELRSDD